VTDTQLGQLHALTGLPPLTVLERMYEVMRTVTVADERARAEAKAGRMPAAFYPVRGLEADDPAADAERCEVRLVARSLRELQVFCGLGSWGLRPRLYAVIRSADFYEVVIRAPRHS